MKPMSLRKTILRPAMAVGAVLMTVSAISVYAQIQKTLEFIPASIDFGVIREEAGKVSRSVKAVNISPDSTFIISARTSCGCSGADYSEEIIAPGDTTIVTVTYDPTNRPGKFLKTAKFFTGEERISNSVKLSGTVIPSRKNLDRAYPDKIGQLRLTTLLVNAGEVSRNEARPLFVGIYNDSDQPLPLSAVTDASPLEAGLAPDTIEPFGIATLSLMLKGRYIPEKEFLYKAYLINAESGDTITCIPVGGFVKMN